MGRIGGSHQALSGVTSQPRGARVSMLSLGGSVTEAIGPTKAWILVGLAALGCYTLAKSTLKTLK